MRAVTFEVVTARIGLRGGLGETVVTAPRDTLPTRNILELSTSVASTGYGRSRDLGSVGVGRIDRPGRQAPKCESPIDAGH